MNALKREIVFLILQFLDEEKFKETRHILEQESGQFFNMRRLDELVEDGKWDEVEKYVSGFTKLDDNHYSMKIFFEIRKQKYLEALLRKDHSKAVNILVKELKVFSRFSESLIQNMTRLLALDDFKHDECSSTYVDVKAGRNWTLAELKKLIQVNPLFHDKIQFPTLKNSRLETLINHSLNWQHYHCKNPEANPVIKSILVDHSCGASCECPVTNPFMGAIPKPGGYHPMTGHNMTPFKPSAAAALPTSFSEWMANPYSLPHPSASSGHVGLGAPNAAIMKRPRSPASNPAMDCQTVDDSRVLKRSRPSEISDEVNTMPTNVPPVTNGSQIHGQKDYSTYDLPKTVVITLNHSSAIKSMDYHPVQQKLLLRQSLLVGTDEGEIMLWDLGHQEKIDIRKFKIWDLGACSVDLQKCMANDYMASINRIRWSPHGKLIGIAYSKNILHILSYHGGAEIRNHLEIEAHVGSVNDIIFSYLNKQPCVISCGEDRVVKVWDAITGGKQYIFEGHEAPVYSICTHQKENTRFIFSTATDGKIKAWLYGDMVSRVNYNAPGNSSMVMSYSADGKRLFSCGTNREGESYLVEWNENKGVKRVYHGLRKRSVGIVQFETLNNRFLAVGHDSMVKFWDMDSANLLTSTHADGGLSPSPCIKINKEGTLLAVSTNENGIKILANSDGIKMLQTIAVLKTTTDNRLLVNVKSGTADESVDKSRTWSLTEIKEPSQCRSLRLPDSFSEVRVSGLIYTNSGTSILALASNAEHKQWNWQKNERNTAGKATVALAPELLQPLKGKLMVNDKRDTDVEDSVHFIALSKNEQYVMSGSGGKVSLYNMRALKIMTTFMPPPPTATFLAFHPEDNNIVAVGMDDSTIQIYDIRLDEVTAKLRGHQTRITGLAFSNVLNVLVSSGANSQLCVWSIDEWELQATKFLQTLPGQAAACKGDTQVQFHLDQKYFLAVHETQIAIYEAPGLKCIKQFIPRQACGPIKHATYSCDSQLIYVCFEDGSVNVITSPELRLRCRINPTAYLPPKTRVDVHPLVVAAHPFETNQFALGLSNGRVYVLEPLETEGRWGISPETENGAESNTPAVALSLSIDKHKPQE